jgi:flagellar biosynthetic protein FlhB
MSGESFQEKTESASPRRRQEAHRKGQVPRSQELTTAMLLLATGGLLATAGPSAANALAELMGDGVMRIATPPTDIAGVTAWIRSLALRTAMATAPLLLGLAATGGAIAALQARGVISADPIKPDWSRLAPTKNIKRIWGVRALAEFAKSVFKLGLIGLAMFVSLRHSWSDVMTLGQQDTIALARALGSFAVRLLLTAGGAYVVLAAADYAFQLWQHEKGLRMTKEEAKQEHKESEGDPLVKSRLRSLGRAMLRRQMFTDVPNADVVVTNPTHIAVALRYDPTISPAPIVLAMGQRKIAERIKRIAHEAGVPVIENKPLARALLKAGRVGLPIPTELYVAVAEILAFVFRRRAAGAWQGSTVV